MNAVQIAKLSSTLVTKLTQFQSVVDVLQVWLSLLPIEPQSVQLIIETLQGDLSTISKRVAKVDKKLNRILAGPNLDCAQFLKMATVSFLNEEDQDGESNLKEAAKAATQGFSLADDVNGWVESTQLRLICALLQVQHVEEDFALISSAKKKWLADMYKTHVQSLRQKTEEKRDRLIQKVKKGKKLSKNKGIQLSEFDLQEGKVLNSAYGVMSEGLGWTNPRKIIPNSQENLAFEVMPDFIPIGKRNAVSILALQEPRICVELHRRHEYSYDEGKKALGAKVTLIWSIGNAPVEVNLQYPDGLSQLYSIVIVNKHNESQSDGMKRTRSVDPKVNPGQQNVSTANLSPHSPSSANRPGSPFPFAEPVPPAPVLEPKSETLSRPSQGIHLPTCSICRQVMKGDRIEALGRSFHSNCFTCSECGCNLSGDDDRFKADESKNIHCFSCYNKKYGKVCFGCRNVIKVIGGSTSQMLKAGGRTYHPDCYRCESCLTKFGDGGTKCYPKNGRFLCSSCA